MSVEGVQGLVEIGSPPWRSRSTWTRARPALGTSETCRYSSEETLPHIAGMRMVVETLCLRWWSDFSRDLSKDTDYAVKGCGVIMLLSERRASASLMLGPVSPLHHGLPSHAHQTACECLVCHPMAGYQGRHTAMFSGMMISKRTPLVSAALIDQSAHGLRWITRQGEDESEAQSTSQVSAAGTFSVPDHPDVSTVVVFSSGRLPHQ